MSLEENKLESVILIDDLIVKKVLIVPDGIPWYIRLKLKFNMALNNVLNKIIDNNFKYIMNIINGIFFGINFVFGIIVHLCRSFDRLHSLYEMYGVFFAIIGIYLMYEIIHSLVGKKTCINDSFGLLIVSLFEYGSLGGNCQKCLVRV